jgi:hypothetical protein
MKGKVAFALITMIVGGGWLLRPTDVINLQTYQRLRLRMTVDEVKSILGSCGESYKAFTAMPEGMPLLPLGRIVTEERCACSDTWPWRADPDLIDVRFWCGRHGFIGIDFEAGRVVAISFRGWRSPSFWERVSSWAGW